MFSFLG